MVKVKKQKRADLEYFEPNQQMLPTRPGIRPGIYLVKGIFNYEEPKEIDVYRHPVKGLCCFAHDFGGAGSDLDGADDRYDAHTSVQFTGLEFIKRVRDLD